MSVLSEFTKGFYKQNPVFKQALGLCPVLAVSNSVESALGMGAAATFVLLCSNFIISLIRKIVPAKIRIPRQKSVVHVLMKDGVPCDEYIEVIIPAKTIGMRDHRRRPSSCREPGRINW